MSEPRTEHFLVKPAHGGAIPAAISGIDAPPGRTPLLFVPGVGGPRDTFHHQIQAFASDRIVVSSNLNPHVARGCDPMTSAAQDLVDVLDQAGVERVDVAGASFGSTVAHRFAVLAPERVRRLAWIAPPVVRHAPWRRAFGPGWLAGGALLKYAPATHRKKVARFLAERRVYSVEPDLDEHELERLAHRISDTQLAPFFQRLVALGGWDWRAIERPPVERLWVVQGKTEHERTPADVLRAWERLAGSPVEVLPGLHMPYLSYPAPFNDALRRFLDHS